MQLCQKKRTGNLETALQENPSIKQKELVTETGKSLSTIKRIMEYLQKKDYIRRVGGKRYGKWEIIDLNN